MKNLRILLCFATIIVCNSLFGQSSLETVRKSTKVKDEITLIVKTKDLIDYYVDSRKTNQSIMTTKSLDTVDYFQVKSKNFRIYVDFVNPLVYRLSASNKTIDDELFKASNDYLSTAIDFLTQVRQASRTRRYRDNAVGNTLPASAKKLEAKLGEMYMIVIGSKSNFFTTNAALLKAMEDLNLFEIQKAISDSYNNAFNNLRSINSINSIEGIIGNKDKALIGSNELLFQTHSADITSLDVRFNDLLVKMGNANYGGDNILKSYVNYKINQIGIDISNFKKMHNEIKSKYESIKELFKNIEAEKHPQDNKKFLLKEINGLKNSTRNELTVTLEKIEFDSNEKKLTVKNKKSFLLNVRKYSTFIPVVSSGVIYTNLSFAQFGTDTDENGNTIVAQTKDDSNEVTLGAYLNLYLNNKWDLPLFFQFGVGPSKEKPLFFLGGGFEILKRVNISTGAVFTWFPELNDLTVGQQVNGTSDIEDDISFAFDTKPKFYIGINFDITKK